MSLARHLFKMALMAVFCLAIGCQSDTGNVSEDFTVTVRLSGEPDNLNPTRSRSATATQIESLILYPLAEYDPFTLELSPLLVTDLADS